MKQDFLGVLNCFCVKKMFVMWFWNAKKGISKT